jgi:ribonuclease HI
MVWVAAMSPSSRWIAWPRVWWITFDRAAGTPYVFVVVEQLDDDALTIYTDGSSYSHPRRGGIGFRFVWTGKDGHEVVHDSDLAGYKQATNNQMEIKAAVEALREAMARWSPVNIADFKKVVVYSDSDYLVSGLQSALNRWPQDKWMTVQGKPVENAELWQALVREYFNVGKRVEFKWIKGKKGVHAKAVDNLAKESAKGFLNEPLAPVQVGRRRSLAQVDLGCVPMQGQVLTIYIRTHKFMPVQKCNRYRYEVINDDGSDSDLVDEIDADRDVLMSRHHMYSVRVNDQQGNPRIVEVLGEVTAGDDED